MTKMHIKIGALSILSILLFSCSSSDDPETEQVNPPDPDPDPVKEWSLVWEDNFDTDLSAWNAWDSGAFNEEVQLYTPSQLVLENGVLSVNVERKEATGATIPGSMDQKMFPYTSGRIETKTTYGPSSTAGEQEYRFMARIQLPAGAGMWPAFWSFGDPWPTKGEIDILEARGNEPNQFQSNVFYGTTAGTATSFNNEEIYTNLDDLTADFHTYELIWAKDKLTILLDDVVKATYTTIRNHNISDLFDNKHKITLNVAVGGIFFPPGDRDITAYADTAVMKVDWVKVYKR